ncbi:MAG: DUF1570 domain-containing protein [Planctomycetaceae bacterium]
MRRSWLCIPLLLVAAIQPASADFLVYHIGGRGGSGGGGGGRSGPPAGMMPGGGMPGGRPGGGGAPFGPPSGGGGGGGGSGKKIVLQGKVNVLSRDTVTYDHPTLKERLYFSKDDVTIYKAKTLRDEYRNTLSRAGKDPDAMMQAAVFALKKGMLKDFYETVEAILKINPKHEAANRVIDLKKKIDTPLPDDPAIEKRVRSVVKRSNMRIAKSKHYVLLHDTPEKPEKGQKKNRAEQRLELLEKVYESFLQFFYSQDIELNIPEERLMVVLFNQEKDFLDYATSVSPSLRSALGFWSRLNNVGVFYDRGSSEEYEELNEQLKAVRKRAEDAKKEARGSRGTGGSGSGTTAAAELVRMAQTLELLATVEKENEDITTVSHECVHQLAGNTGLLPRHVDVPAWVHEGLATYFEAPGDATWSGIGAVNDLRLTWYKGLEDDRVHSNIKFIATNQIFDFAQSHGALVHGYGQAWALTHFLMETDIAKFVQFYRMLGEMPSSTPLNPDLLWELFTAALGEDIPTMDQNWRSYMRGLQTDMQRQAPELMEDEEPRRR